MWSRRCPVLGYLKDEEVSVMARGRRLSFLLYLPTSSDRVLPSLEMSLVPRVCIYDVTPL